MCQLAGGLSGGSGQVGGDDVGGMPVQRGACPVRPHGGARVGVRGGFLNIARRDTGVQRGGDQCVAEGVRPDRLGDAGPPDDAPDDPPSGAPVQPPAIRSQTTGPSLRSPMARSIARAVRVPAGS
jgi:hypothetical protein